MPSPSNFLKSNQVSQMVRTSGSFWNEMMRNNQQTRLLPNLVNKTRILNQLDIGFKQLLSQSNDLFVENQHVKYDPQQVVFAGNTFYDDSNLYEAFRFIRR